MRSQRDASLTQERFGLPAREDLLC